MNFATLRNISQQKKHTEVGTTKEGGGNREYEAREAGNSDPPVPSPPYLVATAAWGIRARESNPGGSV